MPKTISASMQTHIESEVTSLATCWNLVLRDGSTIRVTDHDADITFGGNTYLASIGVTRSAVQDRSDMSVDNMELAGIIDSSVITDEDIRAGRYDYAEVECFLVNHEDPDTFGDIKLRKGTIGEVQANPIIGTYSAEFRGLLDRFAQNTMNVYQNECRVDLGSTKCGVILEAPEIARSTAYAVGDVVSVATDGAFTDGRKYEGRQYVCTVAGTTDAVEPAFDTIIGNPTVDGTATFTCEYSFTQYVTVDTVINNRSFTITTPENDSIAVDNWFKYGRLTLLSGLNSFKAYQVKAYTQSSKLVELLIALPYTPSFGDVIKIQAGCGKTIQTYCRDKFNNVVNFRGEPFIPGSNQFLRYPDAKG